MNKSIESCYQWASSNFLLPEWKTHPSFYYRFLFPMGNPTFYWTKSHQLQMSTCCSMRALVQQGQQHLWTAHFAPQPGLHSGGNSDKLIKWQQLKLPGTGSMCHLSNSKLTCYPVNICPSPNPRVSKLIILPLWPNICLMNCSYMAHALLHKLKAKITGVIFIEPWNKTRVWSTFNWFKNWKGFSPLKTKSRRVRDKEKFKVKYFLLGSMESWQDSNPRHLTNTWRQLLN